MADAGHDDRRRALSIRLPADEVLPTSTTVKVDIGVQSHQGVVRLSNEDHYLIVELGRRQETLAATGRPVSVERRGQDLNHILTDAIGSSGGEPAVGIDHVRLADGDCLLLCTNGLTDMVDDEHIAETLCQRRQSTEQCRMLVELANRMGGRDNITAIVAQYSVPPAPPGSSCTV